MTIKRVKQRWLRVLVITLLGSFLASLAIYVTKYFLQDFDSKREIITQLNASIEIKQAEKNKISKIIADNKIIADKQEKLQKQYSIDSGNVAQKLSIIFTELQKEYSFFGNIVVETTPNEKFLNAVDVKLTIKSNEAGISQELKTLSEEKSTLLLFTFIKGIQRKLMIYDKSLSIKDNQIMFIVYKG